MKTNIVSLFHPVIREWFVETFEHPTPAQTLGWLPISRGENTLILAPTGSGKTLAAFLVCINNLLEKLLANQIPAGVHTLYISPLKALNYDIERNLEEPLSGIQTKAVELGLTLPEIRVAVRTGDTTQKERLRMLQRPPHILITTPESLHLLLTSLRAREILRTVQFVIVDEIHALSENKRGTFLVLLLERLQKLAVCPFVRIGLSATQKPLEEVAKFLGGSGQSQDNGKVVFRPRPVTIVDAGMRKELDLQVVSPVEDFRALPEDSVWPDIYQKLLELIQGHRSTLIFANNRAAVERITAEINDRAGYELVRAHHGSVSKAQRREIEEQLKQGQLPALVATATLELGIDMGAIDLVCQVESPKSVARGLQRVGRAGHVFRAASKGRLIPKMRSDLLETAVITRTMKQADVAPIKIPRNCLDILAQQIVAMVALDPWKIDDLYHLVRQAYPYQNLPRSHFLSVLEMLSGRYPSEAFRDLRPRISWDRVNNVLYPLPGSQRLAILSGGAIPETGQFGCYLEDGFTKIGELEEEFVYETRLGDVFILGTNTWRVKEITHDRVIVAPAPGEVARMPFWKGEFFSRSVHLGERFGQFCRELSRRLDDPQCESWLQKECDLDQASAFNLRQYLQDQKDRAGIIPDDQTILIEAFRDELGDLRVAVLSPFGGRLHLPWRLALLAQFRHRWGIEPESLHSDAGLLFRFTTEDMSQIIQIMRSVTSENVEGLVMEELANSAFFGLRFRQNAGRAMLLPPPRPGKRTPLWLHRMRARDLLEIAQQYESFPIVVETYRESLQDFLAIEELKELLRRLESGQVQLVLRQAPMPSPFASSLLFDFMAGYMYEWDRPKLDARGEAGIDTGLLQELIHPEAVPMLLDENAIKEVERRLQAEQEGYRARTATELIELLRRIGDLTEEEIAFRVSEDCRLMLQELSKERRAVSVFIPRVEYPWRWIAAEDFPLYRDAFAHLEAEENTPESYQRIFDFVEQNVDPLDMSNSHPVAEILPDELLSQKYDRTQAQRIILERYLRHHTLVTLEQILMRYPLEETFVREVLTDLENKGHLVQIPAVEEGAWAYQETVERIRRVTLAQQRRQVQPCDTAQFVDFLLRWQHRTPQTALSGPDGVLTIVEQLQGLALPAEIWDSEIFGRRIADYRPAWLDELCSCGDVVWYGSPGGSGDWGNIAFAFRENLSYFHSQRETSVDQQTEEEATARVREALAKRGASFVSDLALEAGLPPSLCATILWEMIWRGEVTNDTFAVVRAGRPLAKETRPYPYQQNARWARQRLSGISRTGGRYRPVAGSGRWSLLPQQQGGGEATIEILARQLLQRYGLICRELYSLEGWTIPCRLLYETLVRLEWRGEIRRGYFVKGFSGAQFALPQAVDELMAYSQKKPGHLSPEESSEQMILINACDPTNLYGAASPLPLLHPLNLEWRFLRHPGNYLVLKNGLPVLAIEAKGARLTPLRDLSPEEKQEVLHVLPQLLDDPGGLRRIRSIKVEFWNGQPVRNSEIVGYLKQMGFWDEFRVMVLEREF